MNKQAVPDGHADRAAIKSGLVVEIGKAMRNQGLSQEEAGRRMGVPQARVSNLLRGDFSNVSERKLMDCLNRLGYDVEIKVKAAAEPVGRLVLAVTQAPKRKA
ncbi:MAG: helix-turn-helix transcriptional regulator [Pseudomonadota bacterium]